MDITEKPMQDESDYLGFVERYFYLVNGEIEAAEKLREQNDARGLASVLPALISIVNVAGYLRGQDNRFIDLRPSVSFQSALYQKEDEFEGRLGTLIDFVKQSGGAEFLVARVQEYYLRHRGL